MSRTLVVQSHRSPLPYAWIESCLHSVRDWCVLNDYEYRFVGDELFEAVPVALLEKTRKQRVIATDLARLLMLQSSLEEGYDRVVWLDADTLIFEPAEFILPEQPAAVGREVWVQHDRNGRLKVYKKVHNAFLMFRRGNNLLGFYSETAARLLADNQGAMPPQFIGPKLLTALHNVAILPVLESAGMLSPVVVRDLLQGGGPALDLFTEHSVKSIAAANLCISSCDSNQLSDQDVMRVIDLLLADNVF
jgi:hypothetical protein